MRLRGVCGGEANVKKSSDEKGKGGGAEGVQKRDDDGQGELLGLN